jgi:hypothetical protein
MAPGTSTTDEVCGGNVVELGTPGYEAATGIARDRTGNIYVVGDTMATYLGQPTFPGQATIGSYDAVVVQYDASGAVQWIREFGTDSVDAAMAVAVDGENNVYVTGYTYGTFPGETNAGGDDLFLAKYDATGTLLWAHQYGTDQGDFAKAIAVDVNNNVYVAGYTNGAFPGHINAGYSDAFVAQIDTNGTLQWVHQVGTSSFDTAYGVAVDSNLNVYIAGNSDVSGLIGLYSSNGDFYGAWTFGPAGAVTVANGIAIDSSNNVYLAGGTTGTFDGNTSAGGEDAFVISYDPSGTVLWARQFGSNAAEEVSSVAVDSAGTVDLVGYTNGVLPGQTSAGGYGNYDAFLVSYDAMGTQHIKQWGTNATDYATSVVVDGNHSVYITGYSFGTFPGQTPPGNGDMILAKFL